MPWAIHLHHEKTSEVCCSYGKHRGTGAGSQIRTDVSGLEDQSTNHCAIPAYVLPAGLEPTTSAM